MTTPGAKLSPTYLVSYASWQAIFSIQRYAIAIELLLPLAIAVALNHWSAQWGKAQWGKAVFLALALVLALTTRPLSWGRFTTNSASFQPLMAEKVRSDLQHLLHGAAVVLGPPPLSYLAPLVDEPSIGWFGVVFTPADAQSAADKLRRHDAVFAIGRETGAELSGMHEQLRQFGLVAAGDAECYRFGTSIDPALQLCPVNKAAMRRLSAVHELTGAVVE